MAAICFEKRDLGQCIELYKNAIKLEPKFSDAYNNIGNALKEVHFNFFSYHSFLCYDCDYFKLMYVKKMHMQTRIFNLKHLGHMNRLAIFLKQLPPIARVWLCAQIILMH